MRALVAWATYPIVLLGGLAAGYVALERGYSPAIVVGLLGAAAIVVVAILERVHPFVPDWNRARGDVGPDVLHMIVSNLGTTQLVTVLVLGGIAAVAPALSDAIGASLWPGGWPLAAQLILALLAGELAAYWAHRVLHERPSLWPWHAVHHSPDRLYWLNGFRNHPGDVAFQYAALHAPLVLLGAGTEVIALTALLQAVHTPLQHSNIALRTGPLCYVVSTAELHRWHHAPGVEANVNYGTVLSVWDLAFRTFRRRDIECIEVGIEDKAFPRNYLDQLRSPFRHFRSDSDSHRT